MKNSPLSKIVLEAFLHVRDGWAAEYVVCEPNLNAQFIAACRRGGVMATPGSVLNVQLLNLRKQGALTNYAATKRKAKGDPSIQKIVENAIRFLERQLQTNVDAIICDTALRDQFDALVQLLKPGCSVLESRYSALTLRKKNALKPEIVGRVIASTGGAIHKIVELTVGALPTEPGAYLFFDEENTLYAGKADNLRRRIEDHLSTWTARDLVTQIRDGRRAAIFLAIHVLPADITAQSLGAYETEIIRSRNPSHNRSGKPKK